jgi:ATP-dependent Clp protease adaptor protein ClpS
MANQNKTQKQNEDLTSLKNNNFLILHNDDYHTFDYVIDALIDVCEHDIEQAVQSTYLVHYKGKADVKKGSYDFLKPMMSKLKDKKLKATIE